MRYAKVVLGLPVEGPFDYYIPVELEKITKVGVRVWVSFRTNKSLGYVVKLTSKSDIDNLKPILEVIDTEAVLDRNMLLLTKEVSDYYCCSWGEAIETALPESLRRGKKFPVSLLDSEKSFNNIESSNTLSFKHEENTSEITLIHDLDGVARWDIYLNKIKEIVENNRSVIVLLSDKEHAIEAQEIIKNKLGITPFLMYRKQAKESEGWFKIKEGQSSLVVGTRSAIFAPVRNLGLIVIDEEQDTIYKQDQVPHYNAREVAFMRISLEKARLILGSTYPSLETSYLAGRHKIKYVFIPRKKAFPDIKIIDTGIFPRGNQKRDTVFTKYLEDAIALTLKDNGRVLLFLNRKGFSTMAYCYTCNMALKCPRCNTNLVFHFSENILNCHLCNFKMQIPQICPNCNSGYIRFSGIGTEKLASELSRLFPLARIKNMGNNQHYNINEADIFIATESIIGKTNYAFDLIGILSIDNSLNRIDFRAAEKTFGMLMGLLLLTDKKIIVQTRLINHHAFKALLSKNINMFYDEELKNRKELYFPPYRHMGLVKVRGKEEQKVKHFCLDLFKRLNKENRDKSICILSVNPSWYSKLRGNFYWQILVKSNIAQKISKFLKINLKKMSHSGIIITVDIDPL